MNLPKNIQDKLEEGRSYRAVAQIEVRAADTGDSYIVEGYATTFNQPYLLWEYENYKISEQVDRNAFDNTDLSDVIMQYDHMGRVFARTGNGTLQLNADDHGLHIRADLGGTELGRQLYEEIKGGYTTKMSFGFTVGMDERTIEENHENGDVDILRTIKSVSKLYDVSAVSLPANNATDISARSWCDGVIAELTEERRKAEEKEAEKEKAQLELWLALNT